MMGKFDNIYKTHVKEVVVEEEAIVENSLDDVNVPVVYNFPDLLRLKNLPIRFDKQDHSDPDIRYRYVMETKEEYQLSASTLIENGNFSITYTCNEFADDEDGMPVISIVWEFEAENIKLVPKRVEQL
jgi:hypothetical protein